MIPLNLPDSVGIFYVLFFEKAVTPSSPGLSGRLARWWVDMLQTGRTDSAADKDQIQHLRRELEATREYLRNALEEHEAAQEELKSAHEEALSSNEEFQSTNEELETAKEELQSANEELSTTNDELRSSNSRLNLANEALALGCADAAAVRHLVEAVDLIHARDALVELGELSRFERPAPVMIDYDGLLGQELAP